MLLKMRQGIDLLFTPDNRALVRSQGTSDVSRQTEHAPDKTDAIDP
jgi:hypothetical protein